MYLKALQRPRRVPMRCSNEGFFYTTTNLVASLLVNPIIFSFRVRSLLSVSCSLPALFLLLPRALFFFFFPLSVSHLLPPSSIVPLRFPLIDPLFISPELRFKILPRPCTRLSHWLLFIFNTLFTLLTFLLFVFVHMSPNGWWPSAESVITCLEVPALFLPSLNCSTPVKPTPDISPLSQLSVSSQWHPCPRTSPSPNTRASASVCMGGTCPGLSYTHPQCSLGEGGEQIQFSKWHNVLLRSVVRFSVCLQQWKGMYDSATAE